jgi:phage FluMu protein Com
VIQLEIGEALILYSGILILLAGGIWLYTEFTAWRAHRTLGKQYLWHCTFCGFSYLDESAETISKCPRCGSLNSIEDKNARVVKIPLEAYEGAEPQGQQARRNTSKRKRPHQRRRGPRKRR